MNESIEKKEIHLDEEFSKNASDDWFVDNVKTYDVNDVETCESCQ